MGLTIEISSTEDMCRLMCDNDLPMKRKEKNMTVEQMKKHYIQWGIFVFEQYDKNDGRKRFYQVRYPVFEEGKEIPVSDKIYLCKTPSDVKRFIDKVLLINPKFKKQCEDWIKNN